MKLVINDLEQVVKQLRYIDCDHCFCIKEDVEVGMVFEKIPSFPGHSLGKPVYRPHLKCCNCGTKKLHENP